jgi:transglutaminase-like putative cysteine protease
VTAYHVMHETLYRYAGEVVSSHNEAHLLPRALARQTPSRVELRIEPTPDSVRWHRDYFGNDVVFFNLQTAHRELTIRTESDVVLDPARGFEPARSAPWEEVASGVRVDRGREALEALEYVFDSPFVAASQALAAYARPSFTAGRPLAEAVLDFAHRIHAEFRYDPDATTLETPVEDALRERHGVCQDFAHVMIGGLRSLGLPARYVSGYLKSRRPALPDAAADAKSELVGSEASHAWVAAWCPVLGWIEVDPTNDVVPSDRHIVLAWGRDYDDVSPVKGVTLGGGSHTVEVNVSVTPIAEPQSA